MRVDILHTTLFRKALKQTIPELNIPEFTAITIDSRQVQQGDIFVALKGESTDGHCYIEQAQHAGATICIVEQEVDKLIPSIQVHSTRQFLNDTATAYRNFLTCPVIGITGTNGKTTTKDLLTHVLSATKKVMSTWGFRIWYTFQRS